MKNLIIIIGPRRSGLHAVCNWLIGHFHGRVRFINDPPVELSPNLSNFIGCYEYDVGPDKIRLCPSLHLLQEQARHLNWQVAGKLPWLWKKIACHVMREYWDPNLWHATTTLPELDGSGDAPPDTHIILFENLTPAEATRVLPAWLAAYRVRFGLPQSTQETLVIVLRSPWNCLASTLKAKSRNYQSAKSTPAFAPGGKNSLPTTKFGELWTAYAREIIGESQYLNRSQWLLHPLIYDAWVTSRQLRTAIAHQFGLPVDDRVLSQMATYGGGSSFDGGKKIASSPADLTNRWQEFRLHPDMQALLNSPDIHRLAPALGLSVPVIEQHPR